MKDELRREFKIKRRDIADSFRETADAAIAERLISIFGNKESFFVYFSCGTEADTHKIIDFLLKSGKRVFLPRIEGKIIVPVAYFGQKLVKNKYGIEEPEGQAYNGEIAVTVTPLLAINSRGYRLGYGGGYYDRYFSTRPQTLKIGIGYSFQRTDGLSEDILDYPLDAFISEKEIIYFKSNGGSDL